MKKATRWVVLLACARRTAVLLCVAAGLLATASLAFAYDCGSKFDPGALQCNDPAICSPECPDEGWTQTSWVCCCDTNQQGSYGCCDYVCTWVHCYDGDTWCYSWAYPHNGIWRVSKRCQGDGQCN